MSADAANIRSEKVTGTGGTVVLVMYDEDAMQPRELAELISSYLDEGYACCGIVPVGGDEDFALLFTIDHSRQPFG